MFEDDLFAYVLALLAEELAGRPTPVVPPLRVDSYLARSIMQKAIRRGMTDLALRAAAQLIVTDPRVLWRRLLVIALEDLGPGQADLMTRIVASYRDRAWRAAHGGEWAVLAELITQACEGTRCQSANDLWNVAKNDAALDGFKASLCEATMDDLLAIMTDDQRDIGERGAAVLIAIGENAGPPAPDHIPPSVGAVFSAFMQITAIKPLVVAYDAAHRQSRLALAPLALCFWPGSAYAPDDGQDDDLPPVTLAGDVPTFALDQYTRGGKAAVRAYVKTNAEWKAFAAQSGISPADHVAAAGELLFRAEGARVIARRQWAAGADLYARSRLVGCFMPPDAVEEGLALILRQLPLIDPLRDGHITTNQEG